MDQGLRRPNGLEILHTDMSHMCLSILHLPMMRGSSSTLLKLHFILALIKQSTMDKKYDTWHIIGAHRSSDIQER